MSDAKVKDGQVIAVLKTRSERGSYSWREWFVDKHKLDTFYVVTHTTAGVFFRRAKLAQVKQDLPEMERLLRNTKKDDVPKGCFKTAERVKMERELRSPEQKLKDANEEVLHYLDGALSDRDRSKQAFLKRVEKETLGDVVAWAASAVVQSFVGRLCAALLQKPREELPNAIARARCTNAQSLLSDHLDADSTGPLHRAVGTLERRAVSNFIGICDTCLAVYKREGVEIDTFYLV